MEMDRDKKQGKHAGGREGFGDDGGARVGRPDPDSSMARLSENATSGETPSIEGSILDDESTAKSGGARSSQRAEGSGTGGTAGQRTNDHAQRAQSGMGAEGAVGVEGSRRGSDRAAGERQGSEPLRDNPADHKSGYGGEAGAPRTSSDQREGGAGRTGGQGER
jgi:hypothetical protein